ncbi:ferritin heavy chain [Anolis carolinensis]|uniref:ferritin heavy chain n=1 Tax=Anolis carolinensis TaxID=28377 RepID=UPI002F2B2514
MFRKRPYRLFDQAFLQSQDKSMASQIHQNYQAEYEPAVSRLINLEHDASSAYLSMSYHFDIGANAILLLGARVNEHPFVPQVLQNEKSQGLFWRVIYAPEQNTK